MNTENIKEIIEVFEGSNLSKMELEVDDMKIKMEKPCGQSVVQEVQFPKQPLVERAPVQKETVEEKVGHWVKAPIVGTFYITRAAGSAPFVEINQRVKKGDVLCIIEAMKVMNEIHSPIDGIIQEILVTNESMVEFDQELIRISEAA